MLRRGRTTLLGYRGAAALARAVPGLAAQAMAPTLGAGAAFANAERRATISRHLRRIDPDIGRAELTRQVNAAFASYARYWLESFRLPYIAPAAIERGMATEGYDPHVTSALAAGRGVILALPHLGGWEWAGRWLVERGHRVTVVVEALDPPELFEWFADLRRKLGMNVVALGPNAASEVLAALKNNDIVCLLCDRDIASSGVAVDFFGETTRLPAGPATLAIRSGAPLLPTAVYFTERADGHLGIVRPPLDLTRTDHGLRADVRAATQRLAVEFETLIRREPDQWHLFQPNWPSDPGYAR